MEVIDNTLQYWIDEEEKINNGIAQNLSAYDKLNIQSLAAIVAALCNIHVESMLTSKKRSNLFVRWLFYYAYRYYTNCTYDKILHTFQTNGLYATYYEIRSGVERMDGMIDREKYWKHRWGILKNIINSKIDGNDRETIEIEKSTKDVVIVIPKELKDKVKIIEL